LGSSDERIISFLSSAVNGFLFSLLLFELPLLRRDTISGTNIREMIVTGKDWQDLVPEGTKQVLLKIDAKNRLSKIL